MTANYYKILLKLMHVSYGKRLRLEGCPLIFNKGGATLTIGDDVTIKSSFMSNLIGLYSRTIICTRLPDAQIEIGHNVGISGATIYARKGIFIGDHTCIGGNAKLLDNDFHPIDWETRNRLLQGAVSPEDEALVPARAIHIGRNCFIGCNAIILKGTTLGEGCVVGAGAVVSGTFAPGSVIAGNPGRLIRTLAPSGESERNEAKDR